MSKKKPQTAEKPSKCIYEGTEAEFDTERYRNKICDGWVKHNSVQQYDHDEPTTIESVKDAETRPKKASAKPKASQVFNFDDLSVQEMDFLVPSQPAKKRRRDHANDNRGFGAPYDEKEKDFQAIFGDENRSKRKKRETAKETPVSETRFDLSAKADQFETAEQAPKRRKDEKGESSKKIESKKRPPTPYPTPKPDFSQNVQDDDIETIHFDVPFKQKKPPGSVKTLCVFEEKTPSNTASVPPKRETVRQTAAAFGFKMPNFDKKLSTIVAPKGQPIIFNIRCKNLTIVQRDFPWKTSMPLLHFTV